MEERFWGDCSKNYIGINKAPETEQLNLKNLKKKLIKFLKEPINRKISKSVHCHILSNIINANFKLKFYYTQEILRAKALRMTSF